MWARAVDTGMVRGGIGEITFRSIPVPNLAHVQLILTSSATTKNELGMTTVTCSAFSTGQSGTNGSSEVGLGVTTGRGLVAVAHLSVGKDLVVRGRLVVAGAVGAVKMVALLMMVSGSPTPTAAASADDVI